LGSEADLRMVKCENGNLTLSWKSSLFDVEISDMPHFMIENIVAAASVALYYGALTSSINSAAKNIKLPSLRGEIVSLGQRVFTMDCYNANPDSMKKSIKNFISVNKNRNLHLVLGQMGELGKFSDQFHKEIVEFVGLMPEISSIFFVGDSFFNLLPENSKFIFSKSTGDVAGKLPTQGFFLLKGSRSNKLEKILDLLET